MIPFSSSGQSNFLRDLRFMTGVRLGYYWVFCAYFIPVALSGIFIYFLVTFELPTYNNGLRYPDIAYGESCVSGYCVE